MAKKTKIPMAVRMHRGMCKGCKFSRSVNKCVAPGFVKPISPYANYVYDVTVEYVQLKGLRSCDHYRKEMKKKRVKSV